MTHWIELGGKERPIELNYAIAYDYEEDTGGNYNELVFKVVEEASRVGEAMAKNDLKEVAASMGVKNLSDIVYYALLYTHRERSLNVDFAPRDVANWLFSNQEAMTKCLMVVFESLNRDSGEGETTAKKKAVKPRPASNGKNYSKQRR